MHGFSPLVVASHNSGKVKEIAELLAPLAIKVTSAAALQLAEPEETGSTFEANAELKAIAAVNGSGMAALADDSGLVVPALEGAPGIYSARWAGKEKDFSVAMQRVQDELAARGFAPSGTAAYFVCVLALAHPNGTMKTVRGEVHGHLQFPPRGTQGFGYDPIFVADGETLSFGEMDPAKKHRISHRTRAFEALLTTLEQSNGIG